MPGNVFFKGQIHPEHLDNLLNHCDAIRQLGLPLIGRSESTDLDPDFAKSFMDSLHLNVLDLLLAPQHFIHTDLSLVAADLTVGNTPPH